MAAYRKRDKKWNVQVRKSEYPTISKTFDHKRDAQNWAVATERQVQLGEYTLGFRCTKWFVPNDVDRNLFKKWWPTMKEREPGLFVLMVGLGLEYQCY